VYETGLNCIWYVYFMGTCAVIAPHYVKRGKKMNFKSSLLTFCRTILYLIMGYFRMWSTRVRNNNDNNIHYKNETPKVTTSSKQTTSMAAMAGKLLSPPKLSVCRRVYINIKYYNIIVFESTPSRFRKLYMWHQERNSVKKPVVSKPLFFQ